MSLTRRSYLTAVSLVGFSVLGASVGMLGATSTNTLGLLLIILTVVSGLLRVDLEPSGYIDIIPFTLFVTLLLAGPSAALFAVTFSTLVNAKFITRIPWLEAAIETGEQGIAALAAVILAVWTSLATDSLSSGKGLLIFSLIIVTYATVRLLLATARSNLAEGISTSSFVRGAGKYMMVHPIALGIAALGLIFLYRKVGYLALPLATVALFEFYYPAKLFADQRKTLFTNLAVIAQAIDLKDTYTATHSHNVETIALRIARAMRLPETEVRRIRIGALLHDIGKIGVSGRIIRKPAALDPAEQSLMRQHPVIGAQIMEPVDLFSEAAGIVRHHHEHYDGSGYPDGFKGDEIPIGSRIILVADAFSAMTSDRPYRRGRSSEEALQILREHAGKQFDSEVVEVFESVIDII